MPPAYIVAWAALYSLSSMHWFLPAGLRLATLWMLPRRWWWAMAMCEAIAIVLVAMVRGTFTDPTALLLAATVPWGLYALVVRLFARPPGPSPTPDSMMRFLLTGITASVGTAGFLVMINKLDDGVLPQPAVAMLYSFAVGDFIGILVVAPLLRTLLGQFSPQRVPWRVVLANGWVLAPVTVALVLSALPHQHVPLYPIMLAIFPLFWLSFHYGWRACSVALVLLSTAVHLVGVGALGSSWPLPQLQLLIAASGFAGLSLGVSGDALRTQGKALKNTVEMLSSRTRALSDSANRLVSQQEEERRRIGAELHDQLGQDMTAIATRLRLVGRVVDDPDATREGLQSIAALVTDAHEHLREVIQALHPLVLHRFGLARALAEGPMHELARDHGIQYLCSIEGDVDRVPTEVATAIYRICQEATTNCVRHGCGGRIAIHLAVWQHDERAHDSGADVHLRIEDDGDSFAFDAGNKGLGLQSIHDRADAIGAEYVFNPGSGHPRHLLDVRVGA
jgi:glucose-6-phosphate-specific signal transduction histidine kinase